MVETAVEDKGRVAVIIPHGVLFRGSSEGKIRQQFIKENLLDAVIGLPPTCFSEQVFQQLFLSSIKWKKDKNVLFIDSRGV
ncbi:MAG: N-6 DNA methylase [Bdellovibrionota bacterium]